MFSISHNTAKHLADQLDFNKAPLLPVIAVQYDSGEILMQAWMNYAALIETLSTGQVCYYSRSRQSLWRKGETSGHTQTLIGFRTDCDQDSILLLVDQRGPACHTKRRSCFYLEAMENGEFKTLMEPIEK